MVLLTYNYYDEHTVLGVFDSVKKAKAYAANYTHEPLLSWTDPSDSVVTPIWANTISGYLKIEPVPLNPPIAASVE